jgi:hypothetical protein
MRPSIKKKRPTDHGVSLCVLCLASPLSRNPGRSPSATPAKRSCRSGTQHEVNNQGDHREHQQQMDQCAGHVEDCKTARPRNQQNRKQDRPDTRKETPPPRSATFIDRIHPRSPQEPSSSAVVPCLYESGSGSVLRHCLGSRRLRNRQRTGITRCGNRKPIATIELSDSWERSYDPTN